MPEDDPNPRVLDLSPQLDYAQRGPGPARRWLEVAHDILDLLGGWLGLTFVTGLYFMLLAPRAPGLLAGVMLFIGMIVLWIAVVYWVKKV